MQSLLRFQTAETLPPLLHPHHTKRFHTPLHSSCVPARSNAGSGALMARALDSGCYTVPHESLAASVPRRGILLLSPDLSACRFLSIPHSSRPSCHVQSTLHRVQN